MRSIFRNRTTGRERTDVEDARADAAESRADEAEAEAREADRVEAAETRRTPRQDEVVERRPAYGIAAARERFGGVDLPASFVGMLTALALVALLGGIVGAVVGVVGYQTGLNEENIQDISVWSLVGGLVILFVAYLIGGWAAGRIARYDGARNGLMAGILTIVLAAIASALAAWFGDEYDVLRNVDMPQWFSQDAITVGAIISGIVAVAVMLIAGILGGAAGGLYHRRADATITGNRR